jgi:hypothetical protein
MRMNRVILCKRLDFPHDLLFGSGFVVNDMSDRESEEAEYRVAHEDFSTSSSESGEGDENDSDYDDEDRSRDERSCTSEEENQEESEEEMIIRQPARSHKHQGLSKGHPSQNTRGSKSTLKLGNKSNFFRDTSRKTSSSRDLHDQSEEEFDMMQAENTTYVRDGKVTEIESSEEESRGHGVAKQKNEKAKKPKKKSRSGKRIVLQDSSSEYELEV